MFKFKIILLKISLILSAFLYSDTTYQIKDVIQLSGPHLPTVKINNNGIVCGHTIDGPHASSIFIYDFCNEQIEFLKAFDSECTRCFDLNVRNEILGYYYSEEFSPLYGKNTQVVPFLWSKEKGFVNLKSSLGRILGGAAVINDEGWIAGYGFADSIFDFYLHKGQFKTHYSSLIWNREKIGFVLNHPLHPNNFGVSIKSINNNCDAVGGVFYGSGHDSVLGNPAYAFLWDSAQRKNIPIGNLGGQDKFYSCATDINDKKQIVGISEIEIKKTGHGRYYYHAFLWDKGAMLDLGSLEKEDDDSIARAINQHGEIVGRSGSLSWDDLNSKAFLWTRNKGMIDLNTCIDIDENCKLLEAVDINDEGWIVCRAQINYEMHIVLLIPKKL